MEDSRFKTSGLVGKSSECSKVTGVRYLVNLQPLPELWALILRSKLLVIPV